MMAVYDSPYSSFCSAEVYHQQQVIRNAESTLVFKTESYLSTSKSNANSKSHFEISINNRFIIILRTWIDQSDKEFNKNRKQILVRLCTWNEKLDEERRLTVRRSRREQGQMRPGLVFELPRSTMMMMIDDDDASQLNAATSKWFSPAKRFGL